MPDLSDLLGDVYGERTEEAPRVPSAGPRTPEWADDEHLDKAFSEWTPGPSADASETERNMFAATPEPRLADDLAAALSEAVLAETDDEVVARETREPSAVEEAVVAEPAPFAPPVEAPAPRTEPTMTAALQNLEPVTEPTPVVAPTPVHKAGWQRSDDDILPSGRSARGSVRLPKPRAGKGPKAPKAATGPETAPTPKKEKRGLKGLASMELSFGKKKK
jgi:hypothetical protein